MRKIDEIYQALVALEKPEKKGVAANEISQALRLDRANVSRYLNQLCGERRIEKIDGRPVLYCSVKQPSKPAATNSLDNLVGAALSLQVPIQQAKAAILYPPRGLHTLILGETGVGKSMFAEMMYQFAKESQMIAETAPFIRFNCADYADNPQLVMAQIFGVKKGAYSGADSDRDGLLKKADKGIFFLDEIHRLPPQGQEMLFTFIDKGFFRPLGETEKLVRAEVQIIAATTEDPHSHLLKTFTRRIPMMITLPALKERSLAERYHLLEEFIRAESRQLTKDIYIHKSALISFLLYDCPNNIGQLRSDIQLSCAKAFLHFKSQNRAFLLIEQGDLHPRVKRGVMKMQKFRNEISKLLKNKGDILIFRHSEEAVLPPLLEETEEQRKNEYFYDIIEKKLNSLKRQGLDEKEINELLNIDIESYFQRYLQNLPGGIRREEIAKLVDPQVAALMEKILLFVRERLQREMDEATYYGLALHLQESVQRIRQGSKIYHPKLNLVRTQYADEFMAAMEIARIIDDTFLIETPLDEIGYLTMFLAAKPNEEDAKEARVGVLVIMHGHATASSMCQVANTLIGEEYVQALDMPLSMKAETMLETVKQKIVEMNNGRGVLLLVDMGSLSSFGDIIQEETGIRIRTVDMTSTPLVIEACRKALAGKGLDSIHQSCQELTCFRIQAHQEKSWGRKFLVITACFTGEGAAERLKSIIQNRLGDKYPVEIKPLTILDRNDFLAKVQELGQDYQILAVVGTVNVFIDNVPFIPAPDILNGEGIRQLELFIEREESYLNIKNSLKEHLKAVAAETVVDDVRNVIYAVEEELNLQLPKDVKVGIVLHMSFLIDKLRGGGEEVAFRELARYRNTHEREFAIVQRELSKLEQRYRVTIGASEAGYIVRMFIENSVSV